MGGRQLGTKSGVYYETRFAALYNLGSPIQDGEGALTFRLRHQITTSASLRPVKSNRAFHEFSWKKFALEISCAKYQVFA